MVGQGNGGRPREGHLSLCQHDFVDSQGVRQGSTAARGMLPRVLNMLAFDNESGVVGKALERGARQVRFDLRLLCQHCWAMFLLSAKPVRSATSRLLEQGQAAQQCLPTTQDHLQGACALLHRKGVRVIYWHVGSRVGLAGMVATTADQPSAA